jgi:hypothetical protein
MFTSSGTLLGIVVLLNFVDTVPRHFDGSESFAWT